MERASCSIATDGQIPPRSGVSHDAICHTHGYQFKSIDALRFDKIDALRFDEIDALRFNSIGKRWLLSSMQRVSHFCC